MASDNRTTNEGYIPQKLERGYQPARPVPQTTDNSKPQNGYVPTTSGSDHPTNNPTPLGDE